LLYSKLIEYNNSVINNVALTGTIDPVLILFHRLSVLSITNGALHSTIPTLPINIRGLFLSSNELEGSLPAMPSSMANLYRIFFFFFLKKLFVFCQFRVVDHNKLGGFLPDFSQTTLVSSDFTSCVLYRSGVVLKFFFIISSAISCQCRITAGRVVNKIVLPTIRVTIVAPYGIKASI